ncbi:MAG TPA: ferritin-like domain-containing protein [Casimicrobiaceae bacterium]|jgi:bacterioferritin|nr:ferritin-like domain-containing protein [Casimicrobiaceae bacterium]
MLDIIGGSRTDINQGAAVKDKPFLTDVKTLRKRARQHIEDGAVTAGYGGNTETAIKVLNEALATEIVCVLRYKRHYFMARGIHAGPVAEEFLEHAGEEQQHADIISERIVQLGGAPNLSPDGLLSRSHSEYVEGTDLVDMIKEDLVAERIAIDSYREMAAFFAPFDATTRRMIEEIQAKEEEHAEDLADLLMDLPRQIAK